MKNMFGEEIILKAKAKKKKELATTKVVDVYSRKYASGDMRSVVTCPICDYKNVFISGDAETCMVDSCSHFKEILFSSDGALMISGVLFECERKDLPMKSAEVDVISICSFRCPYCNYYSTKRKLYALAER